MNRYWARDEQERATLTREQVEAFLAVELMEKGVTTVEPPALHEIEEIAVETTEYFEVQYKGDYSSHDTTSFVFATTEQAKMFIDAAPLKKDSDWRANDQNFARPCLEMAIMPVELPTHQAVLNNKSALEKLKELKEANKTASEAYHKQCEAVSEAVAGVWEDWRECIDKAVQHQQVQSTLAEYRELCKGDNGMAMGFLLKAYDKEVIRAASVWLGLNDEATDAAFGAAFNTSEPEPVT
jgi:hypothetical protein